MAFENLHEIGDVAINDTTWLTVKVDKITSRSGERVVIDIREYVENDDTGYHGFTKKGVMFDPKHAEELIALLQEAIDPAKAAAADAKPRVSKKAATRKHVTTKTVSKKTEGKKSSVTPKKRQTRA